MPVVAQDVKDTTRRDAVLSMVVTFVKSGSKKWTTSEFARSGTRGGSSQQKKTVCSGDSVS